MQSWKIFANLKLFEDSNPAKIQAQSIAVWYE